MSEIDEQGSQLVLAIEEGLAEAHKLRAEAQKIAEARGIVTMGNTNAELYRVDTGRRCLLAPLQKAKEFLQSIRDIDEVIPTLHDSELIAFYKTKQHKSVEVLTDLKRYAVDRCPLCGGMPANHPFVEEFYNHCEGGVLAWTKQALEDFKKYAVETQAKALLTAHRASREATA